MYIFPKQVNLCPTLYIFLLFLKKTHTHIINSHICLNTSDADSHLETFDADYFCIRRYLNRQAKRALPISHYSTALRIFSFRTYYILPFHPFVREVGLRGDAAMMAIFRLSLYSRGQQGCQKPVCFVFVPTHPRISLSDVYNFVVSAACH